MTTIAALRDAMAGLGEAAEHAAAGFGDSLDAAFAPELPPATAEHGPRAARHVAEQLADHGHHSHLHAYGETVCVSRHCHAGLDALRGLL